MTRFENSTSWSNHFLRRMAAWCCRELEVPVRLIRHYRFRNSRSVWGGVARPWQHQISVCVGSAADFPRTCSRHKPGEKFNDQIECLVAVTAHEIYHVAAERHDDHKQRTRGFGNGTGSSERATCVAEFKVLDAFRAQRESLMALWMESPAKAESAPRDPTAIKLAKAQAALVTWQRRMKRAANKVRKYTKQVRYYEKRRATASSPL